MSKICKEETMQFKVGDKVQFKNDWRNQFEETEPLEKQIVIRAYERHFEIKILTVVEIGKDYCYIAVDNESAARIGNVFLEHIDYLDVI